MKIDLCKIFGVEEGEEFKIEHEECRGLVYKVKKNYLKVRHQDEKDYSWRTNLSINVIAEIKNIIKLPKKKQFTDDELCILRNIDKSCKWIARDDNGNINVYLRKPSKRVDGCWKKLYWYGLANFNHIFKCIQWEDEEPVFIDDYVER